MRFVATETGVRLDWVCRIAEMLKHIHLLGTGGTRIEFLVAARAVLPALLGGHFCCLSLRTVRSLAHMCTQRPVTVHAGHFGMPDLFL